MPRYDTAYAVAVAAVGVARDVYHDGNPDAFRVAVDRAVYACECASIDYPPIAHATSCIVAAYALIGSAQSCDDAELIAIDDACDRANAACDDAGVPHVFDDTRCASDWLDTVDTSNDDDATALTAVAMELWTRRQTAGHGVSDAEMDAAADRANAASIDRTFDNDWGYDDDDAPIENTHAHAQMIIDRARVAIDAANTACDDAGIARVFGA